MKKWTLCLLGLLSLATVALAHAEPAAGGADKAILALENEWLQAMKSPKAETVVPNFDERFVNTDSSGKVTNKAQGLADLKATKFASAEYEDLTVTVFGDAAVVTGGFKGKGTDSAGKAFDVHERWTDTWVRTPAGK